VGVSALPFARVHACMGAQPCAHAPRALLPPCRSRHAVYTHACAFRHSRTHTCTRVRTGLRRRPSSWAAGLAAIQGRACECGFLRCCVHAAHAQLCMRVGVSQPYGRHLRGRLTDPALSPPHPEPPRLLITDERGVVCSREEVDSRTGCCKAGSVHTCGR